jgi:hypothetical protein
VTARMLALLVTDCAEAYRTETSRIPHFLENRFADGVEVLSLTRRLRFTAKEDYRYSFLLEVE